MIEAIPKLSKDPSEQNPQQMLNGKVCVCVSDTELQDYICRRPCCLWAIMQNNNYRKIAEWSVRQNHQPSVLFEQACCNDAVSWGHLDVMWGTYGCWIYITNMNIPFLIFSGMTFHTTLLSRLFSKRICSSHISASQTVVNAYAFPVLAGAGAVPNLKDSDPVMCQVCRSAVASLIQPRPGRFCTIGFHCRDHLHITDRKFVCGTCCNSSIITCTAEGTPISFRFLAQKSCRAVCGSHHGIRLCNPSTVL